jgi:hypothetical protein
VVHFIDPQPDGKEIIANSTAFLLPERGEGDRFTYTSEPLAAPERPGTYGLRVMFGPSRAILGEGTLEVN